MKIDKIFDRKIGDELYCIKSKRINLIGGDYIMSKSLYYKIVDIRYYDDINVCVRLYGNQNYWFYGDETYKETYIYNYFADKKTEREIKLNNICQNLK